MKKRLILLMVLALLLVTHPLSAKTQSEWITLELDLTAQSPGQPAKLWIPYPVSDRDQVISNIR